MGRTLCPYPTHDYSGYSSGLPMGEYDDPYPAHSGRVPMGVAAHGSDCRVDTSSSFAGDCCGEFATFELGCHFFTNLSIYDEKGPSTNHAIIIAKKRPGKTNLLLHKGNYAILILNKNNLLHPKT